jgi:hypothetical protein
MITRMTIMTSFPEVSSAYARQAALGVLSIDLCSSKCSNHAVRHRLYVTGIDPYLRRRLLPTPIGRDVRPFDVTSLDNLHTNYTPPP